MYYTVYKITNKLNNKFYIGKHQTKNLDDGYMGSGKLIKRAIKKHGMKNFKKDIIHIFDNEKEMNEAEKELVILCEECYNLCEGGKGGFSFINKLGLNWTQEKNIKINGFKNLTPEQRQKFSKMGGNAASQKTIDRNKKTKDVTKNVDHMVTPEILKKRIETQKNNNHQKGEKNSQYGSRWITNGVVNKKLKASDEMPTGFDYGYKNKSADRHLNHSPWPG